MIFIGLFEGTKGYIFMRSPNNVIFTAIQALFDEMLFPKCPNMRRPGYTPVGLSPDDLQGEHNRPPDDENEDYGGDYRLSHIVQQHLKALMLFSSHLQCLRHLVEEDLLHGRQGMMMMTFMIMNDLHLLEPLLLTLLNGNHKLHTDHGGVCLKILVGKRPLSVKSGLDHAWRITILRAGFHHHHLHLPGNQKMMCLYQHQILGTSLDVQGDRDNLQSDLTMFTEIGLL